MLTEPAPPCYSERILLSNRGSVVTCESGSRRLSGILRKAKRRMIAYTEDEERAHALLGELTFLIDDLFARSIDVIQISSGHR